MRHRDTHAAKHLDPLRNGIDQRVLFGGVFVEEQVQLIEGWTCHLPVMFLI